jgi:hypothetical protein
MYSVWGGEASRAKDDSAALVESLKLWRKNFSTETVGRKIITPKKNSNEKLVDSEGRRSREGFITKRIVYTIRR